MTTDIMTIREVAEYLKIVEKTAYRLAAKKRVAGVQSRWELALPAERD